MDTKKLRELVELYTEGACRLFRMQELDHQVGDKTPSFLYEDGKMEELFFIRPAEYSGEDLEEYKVLFDEI